MTYNSTHVTYTHTSSHQSIGVTIDSNSPAILKPARKGNVWVQTDRTHWLVNLHGDAVAMTTHHDHTLPLEASLEGIAVDILVHYSGRELGIECSSDGGRGVEELSGSLQLKDYRGRPILVRICCCLTSVSVALRISTSQIKFCQSLTYLSSISKVLKYFYAKSEIIQWRQSVLALSLVQSEENQRHNQRFFLSCRLLSTSFKSRTNLLHIVSPW